MSDTAKPSTKFWILSALALIWNAMGVGMYFMMMGLTAEVAAQEYGQAFADIFATKPVWATGAFAVAVFAGLLGSIALLLRKKMAFHLFIVSLIGVLVHNFWGVMAGTLSVVGTADKVMTIVVMVVAVFLIWFAKKKTDTGVLN